MNSRSEPNRSGGGRLRAASMFSGIGAPEIAAPHWDWRWCAEIERFPSAVYAARHCRKDGSAIPNLGDVTAPDFIRKAKAHGAIDVLVFGSPCQSFSVAGKRLGLDDPRGNLALVALEVARQLRPRWLVFENVPGLLSSDGGRDFGIFLGLVEQCGYSGGWRILDAQYAGVPQRRRRIFFVGYLGDWRPAAAVLFEPESLRGDPPPGRETRQDFAGTVDASAQRRSAPGAERGGLIPQIVGQAMSAKWSKGSSGPAGDEHHNLIPCQPVAMNLRGRNGGAMPEIDDKASVRAADGGSSRSYVACIANAGVMPAVAFQSKASPSNSMSPSPVSPPIDVGKSDGLAVNYAYAVRRLTPVECERLMGVPDNFTRIAWRGKPEDQCPDGPRYKALGNSMAVPVIGWILGRIETCSAILAHRLIQGDQRAA